MRDGVWHERLRRPGDRAAPPGLGHLRHRAALRPAQVGRRCPARRRRTARRRHRSRRARDLRRRRVRSRARRGPVRWGSATAFRMAVATSQSEGVRLRVRLVIGPSAAALHELRWETMRDPRTARPCSTSENVLFSRYLEQPRLAPGRARAAREDLRALVVVAAPSEQLGRSTDGRVAGPVRRRGRAAPRARRAGGLTGSTRCPAPPGTTDDRADRRHSCAPGTTCSTSSATATCTHERAGAAARGRGRAAAPVLGSELVDADPGA